MYFKWLPNVFKWLHSVETVREMLETVVKSARKPFVSALPVKRIDAEVSRLVERHFRHTNAVLFHSAVNNMSQSERRRTRNVSFNALTGRIITFYLTIIKESFVTWCLCWTLQSRNTCSGILMYAKLSLLHSNTN